MLQDTVWLISVLLIAATAAVFLWVATGARRTADGEVVLRRAYRLDDLAHRHRGRDRGNVVAALSA
jgi:hypothetical protein